MAKKSILFVQKLVLFSLLTFLASAFFLSINISQSSSGLLGITGAVSITGAAIAGLKVGKLTYISLGLLVSILSASCLILGFFSYVFMCIKNSHVMFDFNAAWNDLLHKK